MRLIGSIFVAGLLASGAAVATDSWMELPGNGIVGKMDELPRASFAEVPVSVFRIAEKALGESAIVPLPTYGTDTYEVQHLKCRPRERLYLLRAIYGNPSTGGFSLYRKDASLIVMHQYLGAAVPESRSALVACLSFAPKHVYVTLGGGM